MKVAGGTSAFEEDAPPWPSALMGCCAPFVSCFKRKPSRSREERRARVADDQLTRGPDSRSPDTGRTQRLGKKWSGSSRVPDTRRSQFRPKGASRAYSISSPSNFRHIQSGSHYVPETQASRHHNRPRDEVSRQADRPCPFELNLCLPDPRVSPLLPNTEFPRIITPPPPPAYCAESHGDKYSPSHNRCYSSMSFHVPRRLPVKCATSPLPKEELPQPIPARPKLRGRSYTSSDVDAMKERIASALIEVERLQAQIDDVVERQSLYSRPSTAHSMAHTVLESEPMPTMPATPPAAPSFAERFGTGTERPRTAPLGAPPPSSYWTNHFRKRTYQPGYPNQIAHAGLPLEPPLPLSLRPPLRKKKSFTRVSSWLFPDEDQPSNVEAMPATSGLEPIKNAQGTREAACKRDAPGLKESESLHSLSTWEAEDEEGTVPTTLSPGSISAPRPFEQANTFQTAKATHGLERSPLVP